MKEGVPVTISKKSMKWIPWLLVLPVVIIRGFTTLYPILMTVRNSFFDILQEYKITLPKDKSKFTLAIKVGGNNLLNKEKRTYSCS